MYPCFYDHLRFIYKAHSNIKQMLTYTFFYFRKQTIQTMVSGDQWQHHSESVEMKASTSGSVMKCFYGPND